MRNILCYALTLFLLILVDYNFAEASYCNYGNAVFFGNGMFNEQSSADSSLRRLKRMMITAGELPDEEWTFELSYNHSEGIYSLFEVYRQSMGDQAASFWRWLGSQELAPEWFQTATHEIAASYDVAEAIIDVTGN